MKTPPQTTDTANGRDWPLFLTAEDAAAFLGFGVSTFYRIKDEDATLPKPRKPGGSGMRARRYYRPDLEAWAAQQPRARGA